MGRGVEDTPIRAGEEAWSLQMGASGEERRYAIRAAMSELAAAPSAFRIEN
jgi:hypothetical protein